MGLRAIGMTKIASAVQALRAMNWLSATIKRSRLEKPSPAAPLRFRSKWRIKKMVMLTLC